jgi:hypothetical protein
MAMMGACGRWSRMQAVADTPSSLGMMMSMKMRSNCGGGFWLKRLTASKPSDYGRVRDFREANKGTSRTARSTVQPRLVRNLRPIFKHILSSSTRKI